MSGVGPSDQNLANVQFVKKDDPQATVKANRTYTRILPKGMEGELRTNIHSSVRGLKDVGNRVRGQSNPFVKVRVMHGGEKRDVMIQVASLQAMAIRAGIQGGPDEKGGWDLRKVNALQAGQFLAKIQAALAKEPYEEPVNALAENLGSIEVFNEQIGRHLSSGEKNGLQEAEEALKSMEELLDSFEKNKGALELPEDSTKILPHVHQKASEIKGTLPKLKALCEASRLAVAAHKAADKAKVGLGDFEHGSLEDPRSLNELQQVSVSFEGQGAKQVIVRRGFVVDGERTFRDGGVPLTIDLGNPLENKTLKFKGKDDWDEVLVKELYSLMTKDKEDDKWEQVKNLTAFLTGTPSCKVLARFTEWLIDNSPYVMGGGLDSSPGGNDGILGFQITKQGNELKVECKTVKAIPGAMMNGNIQVSLKEPASLTMDISMTFDLDDSEMHPKASAKMSVNFPIENFVLPANDGNQ